MAAGLSYWPPARPIVRLRRHVRASLSIDHDMSETGTSLHQPRCDNDTMPQCLCDHFAGQHSWAEGTRGECKPRTRAGKTSRTKVLQFTHVQDDLEWDDVRVEH